MLRVLSKIITIGDSSFYGAIFVLVFSLALYLAFSYINSDYKPNYEFDLVRKRYIDRTIYNNVSIIICALIGLCSFLFLVIGVVSFSKHTIRAYNRGVNEMTVAIENNIDNAFGGRENRLQTMKDIKSVEISEFSMKKVKKYRDNPSEFTKDIDDYLYDVAEIQY